MRVTLSNRPVTALLRAPSCNGGEARGSAQPKGPPREEESSRAPAGVLYPLRLLHEFPRRFARAACPTPFHIYTCILRSRAFFLRLEARRAASYRASTSILSFLYIFLRECALGDVLLLLMDCCELLSHGYEFKGLV